MNGQKLLLSNLDYRKVEIPEDAVVYCDPPYAKTEGYRHNNRLKFDSAAFWEWARENSKKAKIYVSETDAPDDFACVASFPLRRTFGRFDNSNVRIEKLFVYKNS